MWIRLFGRKTGGTSLNYGGGLHDSAALPVILLKCSRNGLVTAYGKLLHQFPFERIVRVEMGGKVQQRVRLRDLDDRQGAGSESVSEEHMNLLQRFVACGGRRL